MNKTRPPKYVERIIEWYCDPYLAEGIMGDLSERFEACSSQYGSRRARLLYQWQATGFLRLRFRNKNRKALVMRAMWVNYFRTASRSMMRNKTYFGINLVGLVFAVACTLFGFIYIQDDLGYDRMHDDKDQIYRLYKRHLNEREGTDHLTAETSGLMGPTMQTEYAEVDQIARVCPWWGEVPIFHEDETYVSKGWYFVDSTFLDIFDFELASGDLETALVQPRSAIISESLARNIYGSTNPVGETFVGFGDLEYIITGVSKDVERQSTLQFDVLVSWTTTIPDIGPLGMSWMNNWRAQGIFTFVKLQEGASAEALVQKLPDMMERFFPERADRYFLRLQPFAEVHLQSEDIMNQRGMDLSSMRFVYMLSFSALLLVLIVMVNYINISLSRAMENRLEVGVRKVLGSTNGQLLGRFIIETFVSTLAASVIAVILLAALLPTINQITGKSLPLTSLYAPGTLLVLFGISVVFSMLVGLYPAIVLAKPRVTTILKSGVARTDRIGYIRKGLLGLQYALATILIVSTAAVIQQTQYLKNKPLGFDKQDVVVVDIDNEVAEKADVLEAELIKHPNINAVSICRSALGGGSYSTTFKPAGSTDELNTRVFIVDAEFFETYGINTNIGRTFIPNSIADSMHVIVNQSMVDMFSWDDPLDMRLIGESGGAGYPVIGVVDDFHYNSLATATIEPMAIFLSGDSQNRNASIKLGDGDIDETLAYIEEAWTGLATKSQFEYYFVDQWFDELYETEAQLVTTTSIYSIICILLCALGLYGLTALILGQKMREIGIRKILGASTKSIIELMGRQFLPIIVISLILAAPVSYKILEGWLDNFAYGISLGGGVFVIAALIILAMSVLIIGLLSTRAASMSPSKTMRTD